jgi:hypothetical protein
MDLHPYNTVCHDTTRHDTFLFKIGEDFNIHD